MRYKKSGSYAGGRLVKESGERMGVKTQIDRISDKVTEQTALIEEIGTILEGKAAAVPVLQEKTIKPSTAVQEVTPDNGYDGLSKVTVSDIKLQEIMVTPSKFSQLLWPDGGYDGIGGVTVDSVLNCDANLVPENIADGVRIFGVKGTHKGGLEGWTVGEATLTMMSPTTRVVSGNGFTITELKSIPSAIYLYVTSDTDVYKNSFLCIPDTNNSNVFYTDYTGDTIKLYFSVGSAGFNVFFDELMGVYSGYKVIYAYNTKMINTTGVNPKVNSITATGSYTSSTYQQGYWAAITSGNQLMITVKGGTTTAYESIYFTNASLPSGVTLEGQSYYSGTSMTSGSMYVAVYKGIKSDVNITLNFDSTSSSSDYVRCAVTIAYV